jgi:hypothetical protein
MVFPRESHHDTLYHALEGLRLQAEKEARGT